MKYLLILILLLGTLYGVDIYEDTTLNPSNTLEAKNSMSGTFGYGYVGEFVDYGDIVYLNTDGKWYTYGDTTTAKVVMMAEDGKANKLHKFLIFGYATKYNWSWTVSENLYPNTTTAGDMTQSEATGNKLILGVATATNEVYFDPDAFGTGSSSGGLTEADIDTYAELNAIVADQTLVYSGGAFHDGFSDFVANEHIDWTVSQAPTVIHADNYVIPDNSITEVKLNATNSPTDGYFPSYDSGSGGFTWESVSGTGWAEKILLNNSSVEITDGGGGTEIISATADGVTVTRWIAAKIEMLKETEFSENLSAAAGTEDIGSSGIPFDSLFVGDAVISNSLNITSTHDMKISYDDGDGLGAYPDRIRFFYDTTEMWGYNSSCIFPKTNQGMDLGYSLVANKLEFGALYIHDIIASGEVEVSGGLEIKNSNLSFSKTASSPAIINAYSSPITFLKISGKTVIDSSYALYFPDYGYTAIDENGNYRFRNDSSGDFCFDFYDSSWSTELKYDIINSRFEITDDLDVGGTTSTDGLTSDGSETTTIFLQTSLTTGQYTSSEVYQATAGESIAFGDVIYLKSADSEVYICDGDDPDSFPALGFVVSTATDGNTVNYIKSGRACLTAWSFSNTDKIYIKAASSSGDCLTATAPTTTDYIIQKIGQQIATDIIEISIPYPYYQVK